MELPEGAQIGDPFTFYSFIAQSPRFAGLGNPPLRGTSIGLALTAPAGWASSSPTLELDAGPRRSTLTQCFGYEYL